MSDLGFRVQGSKAYVVRNGNEKEVPRESILEIYQLVLGHISPNRDYSNVTSVRKLLRIIDLECEPDESEDESDKDESEEEEKPKPSKPRGRRPAARKPAPKEESEDEDEEESEDEDSE